MPQFRDTIRYAYGNAEGKVICRREPLSGDASCRFGVARRRGITACHAAGGAARDAPPDRPAGRGLAQRNPDMETSRPWMSLLADDYMAITPTGILQSKEQALANLRAGTVHFNSIDLSDRKVRLYGTTALVTSRAEVAATGPDGNISGSYRYTRVYVKDAHGVWRIVSFEANRIREPGEHR